MTNIFDRQASANQEQSPEQTSPENGDELRTDEPTTESTRVGTARDIKELAQELLKYGYIDESRKQHLFRRAVVHERALTEVLEPLDLALRLDTHRGVAFLVVATPDSSCADGTDAETEADQPSRSDQAWSHPLVRRQRLTLEQSLLVSILRQAFVIHEQESGVGQSDAKIAVDELLPQFLTYLEDSGSDAKNESRLLNLLDQLKGYGIVSEVDKKQEVTIRPLIAHLANPASLAALLQTYREQVVTQE